MPGRRIGVVGAGIIGLAVARRHHGGSEPDATVTVLEKERESRSTRPAATAASSTRGSTTRPDRSRRALPAGCRAPARLLRASVGSRCGLRQARRRARRVASRPAARARAARDGERRPGHPLDRAATSCARSSRTPPASPVSTRRRPRSPTTAPSPHAFADDVRAAGGQSLLGAEVTAIRRRAPRAGRDARATRFEFDRARDLRRAAVRPARAARGRCAGADDRPVPRRVLPARDRSARTSCAGSSTRCPTPPIRSSACTSRTASTVGSTSGPTPSSRSRARATGAGTSASPTSPRRSRSRGFRALARKHWRMGVRELRGSLLQERVRRRSTALRPGGDGRRSRAGARRACAPRRSTRMGRSSTTSASAASARHRAPPRAWPSRNTSWSVFSATDEPLSETGACRRDLCSHVVVTGQSGASCRGGGERLSESWFSLARARGSSGSRGTTPP